MTETSNEFDIVIVGGGTAGAILAARLSEDPKRSVCLIEWGPSDVDEMRALAIRRWPEMFESEYDLDYRSVPQARGNSHVQQARARILGGCSSHNTMISFRTPRRDLARWADLGARGWDAETFLPYYDRLLAPINPIPPAYRNPYVEAAVSAAVETVGVPRRDRWNDSELAPGAGFLEIGYDPATGIRSSSSVAYLHPLGDSRRNLEIWLECRATKLSRDAEGRLTTVELRRADGSTTSVRARSELLLCAGAIDTPRLLLLSGIGPADDLKKLDIPVSRNLPGIGLNLNDHPEGIVMWEAREPLPTTGATDWDAVVVAQVLAESGGPDILMHLPASTYDVHTARLGYETPQHSITMTPNVMCPRSRGTVSLDSPDPDDAPVIDYGYFTDSDGVDERTLVGGVKLARSIAASPQLERWIGREVFPGPDVVADDELSALERAVHNTVYHVSGTCRMGLDNDAEAVVDSRLRLRGEPGVRVVDASVFPCVTSVNTVITVMMLAERASDLIAEDLAQR